MNTLNKILFLFFLYIYTAESVDPVYYICNTNGSSQISRNIQTLLPQLVSGTLRNGFISTSYGRGPAQIFGLAQCRGDVSKSDCSTCIQDAASNALRLCPNQAHATIWYDYCFLKYNTVNFFGQIDTSGIYLINVENVTDVNDFNKKLGKLMDNVESQAVWPVNRGLGKGESDLSPFVKLYALVQCTRDLLDLNCAQCLSFAVGNFPTVCPNRRGCRVLYGSCYVRYELYPFFFPLDSQGPSNHSSKSIMAIAP